MKTFIKNIIKFAMIIVFMLGFSACEKNTIIDPNKTVTVGLNSTGDIEMFLTPLTKSDDDDDDDNDDNEISPYAGLYGIQVWKNINENDRNGIKNRSNLEPVAYGIFRDLSEFDVELIKENTYSFEVRYVVGDENTVKYFNTNTYDMPFKLCYHSQVELDEVYYSSTECLNDLDNNIVTQDKTIFTSLYNTVDNFYGFESYKVSDEDDLDVDLYRMVFGMKFIIDNQDPDAEKLLIKIPANVSDIKYFEVDIEDKSEVEFIIPIISLNNISQYLNSIKDGGDNFFTPAKLSLGVEDMDRKYFYGDVNIYRNSMHNIKITIKDNNTEDVGIDISCEDIPMKNIDTELQPDSDN